MKSDVPGFVRSDLLNTYLTSWDYFNKRPVHLEGPIPEGETMRNKLDELMDKAIQLIQMEEYFTGYPLERSMESRDIAIRYIFSVFIQATVKRYQETAWIRFASSIGEENSELLNISKNADKLDLDIAEFFQSMGGIYDDKEGEN